LFGQERATVYIHTDSNSELSSRVFIEEDDYVMMCNGVFKFYPNSVQWV